MGNLWVHRNKNSPFITDIELGHIIINKTTTHQNNLRRQQFLNTLHRYNQNTFNVDDVDINFIFQVFVFLMNKHNTDEEFEVIFNALGGFCDVNNCKAFQRNYRNRCNLNINHYNDKYKQSTYQILDKIHCYYMHTFDLGYRLHQEERDKVAKMCHNENTYFSDHYNKNVTEYYFKMKEEYTQFEKSDQNNHKQLPINVKIQTINELVTTKRNALYNVNMLNNRICAKYSSLTNHFDNKQIDSTNNTLVIQNTIYSSGIPFKYGYTDEQTSKNAIIVTAKYSSLKDELIMNNISTISIEQYDTEYSKAKIHFACHYRRKRYRFMKIEYLLSLMIYCNFDSLQNRLTKTYYLRNHINIHNNFYYMGKYLKISVHKFGCWASSYNSSFYHGINQKCYFLTYIGLHSYGLPIYSPLSTSLSFEVATNFTGMNKGMVIQFAGFRAKYFSVSWLSDYANESECLFIQNKRPLEINNIVDVEIGIEFDIILRALKLIENVTDGKYLGKMFIPRPLAVLAIKIIHHQLSYKLSKYKPFKSLNKYGKAICNTYCKNKTYLLLSPNYKIDIPLLSELFFHSGNKWIGIKEICMLFPNIKTISMYISLSSLNSILEDILSNLDKQTTLTEVHLHLIYDYDIDDSIEIPLATSLAQYRPKFQKLRFNILQKLQKLRFQRFISCNNYKRSVYVEKIKLRYSYQQKLVVIGYINKISIGITRCSAISAEIQTIIVSYYVINYRINE
eukprot:482552_1